MAGYYDTIRATGAPADLWSLIPQQGPNAMSAEDRARAAGYRVEGNQAIMTQGMQPAGVMNFGTHNVTAPLSAFAAPADGPMQQLQQALFGDFNAMQGASGRNFQRGNIPIEQLMKSMNWDSADLERLGNEGAASLNPLDQQMVQGDQALGNITKGVGVMEQSANDSYDAVMRRLRQSDADINAGYSKQNESEATLKGAINEYGQRTQMQESTAADNIAGQVDSQIKQLNADPNLRPEEKAALRYQMRAQVMPSIQKAITDIGTQFNQTMLDAQKALASLQSQGAQLRVSGASAKMYGTQIAASAGGQRTSALAQGTQQRAAIEAQRQGIRESRAALKQMQYQMREGSKLAAADLRLQGNEALASMIERNPESPVSMAAVFATMMAARSAPSSGGGRRPSQQAIGPGMGMGIAWPGGGGPQNGQPFGDANWASLTNGNAGSGMAPPPIDQSYSAGSTSQGSNRPR